MKKTLLALSALLAPAFAYAQEVDTQVRNLEDIIRLLIGLINIAIPIIISLAVLIFIWGVFLYVVKDADEEKAKGKSFMLWGIIGIFVMVSVWGLVNILTDTFNLDNDIDDSDIPELPIEQVNL